MSVNRIPLIKAHFGNVFELEHIHSSRRLSTLKTATASRGTPSRFAGMARAGREKSRLGSLPQASAPPPPLWWTRRQGA